METFIFKITIFFVFLPFVFSACDRVALLDVADKYIASQESGTLDPILADAIYNENNRESTFDTGLLSQALSIDHSRTSIDETECATYTELVSLTGEGYVIGTQIRFATPDIEDENEMQEWIPTLIDSIVSTEGDWLFDASATMSHVEEEDWGEISEEERDTRETLKEAADAYLDLWGPDADFEKVPWGTPCNRMEGSAYTDGSCSVGIPEGDYPPNSDRRYVIDENRGSVSVLCVFETMGDAPDSHELRIEGGMLRFVHTVTVMRDL